MSVNKQNLPVPFSTGIDQKTDPFQLAPTKLSSLVNAVYTKDKRLTKRNGFGDLTQLADPAPLSLTTFNGNLTVVGERISAYNSILQTWVDRGRYQGVELSVTALANNSFGKSRIDAIKTEEGYVLAVYLDSDGIFRYQVSDFTTSQLLIPPTALVATTASAKTFKVGNNLVIVYMWDNGGTPTLSYISIPLANLIPNTPELISNQVGDETLGYDGAVYNDNLYIAWNAPDVGDGIRFRRYSPTLSPYSVQLISTGSVADLISVTTDSTGVWVSWYQDSDTSIHTTKRALNGALILAEMEVDGSQEIAQLTSSSSANGVLIFGEVVNEYSYEAIRSDYVTKLSVTNAGSVTGPTEVVRSLGLASKSFIYNNTAYFLGSYQSELQPSYFLSDENGNIVAKLAYSNGGGYVQGVALPSATVEESNVFIGYQLKDFIASKANPTNPANAEIYAQTGASIACFNLAPSKVSTGELAENLHISGGFVWAYDGSFLVEHNYHVFPEDLEATTSGTGGFLTAQQYRYIAVYEWTDAQGNIHRSAPSQPTSITTSGSTSSNTINIPTLRLTYKPDVRITLYRWSVAQQSYYLITSITSPLLNDPTVDSVEYVDTVADSGILGNALLYTTGGVVENIAYPAAHSIAIYKNRLMVLSSEDRNVVLYSKKVYQGTPVEPSDLFTIYIAPTTGSQGSTGPSTILTAMDDKFLIFKEDACFWMSGDGPNDLGQQNTFSEPIFISSTVGCDNQRSVALIPQGIMFQSDKGIWLLDRGLNTSYIGSDVETLGINPVTSAEVIPNTNQVRFILSNGQALMYDYYYGRWATFDNIPSISSTIFQQLHTYLTPSGLVRQETPGLYLDGSVPVTISFETAWINVAGLQGLERVVDMYLIGQFKTPHKLSMSVSYDYEDSPTQQEVVVPLNYAGNWGSSPNYWGQGEAWGGTGSKEQERLFFERQKVQAVKVLVQEIYDPTQGAPPGEGLTLSGFNITAGIKKFRPTIKASSSV